METYRLKSKLMDNDKEFVIQTLNDVNLGAISSEVYVNGQLAETVSHPHPMEIRAEEVLSLLKVTHGEKKKEIETLLAAQHRIMEQGDPEMLIHLGTALHYKGFYTEAAEVFTALVTIDPSHHQGRNFLGMTELARGDASAAVAAAALAVEKCPGYADYRNNYGEALLAAGETARAIEQFEEAIRINLYYGDAYLNVGLACLRHSTETQYVQEAEQLVTRAADSFRRAAVINPDYDTGMFENGMRALQENELDQAAACMTEVRRGRKERHRREFAGFYMRFVLHPEWVSERTLDERVRYLEREIRRNPQYVDLYAELGRCYLEQSRLNWHRGIQQYKKALQLNPSLSEAAEKLESIEQQYSNLCALLDTMGQKG